MQAIQQAHYQFALDVCDQHVLVTIAGQLGIEKGEWLTLMRLSEQQIHDDIQQSQQLMEQWTVRGFPTFIMEKRVI